MLVKFNNEVLSKGAQAVLPQNLSTEWLGVLQAMAEEFLDRNYDLNDCNKPEDLADPLLTVCVAEILRAGGERRGEIPLDEMLEKVTLYALALLIEAVDRETDVGIAPPSLADILSWERITALRKSKPELIATLEQACVLKGARAPWLQRIRKLLGAGD